MILPQETDQRNGSTGYDIPPGKDAKETLLPPTVVRVISTTQWNTLGADFRIYLQPGTFFIPDFVGWKRQVPLLFQLIADNKQPVGPALPILSSESSIQAVLSRTLQAIERTGVRVLLIDPPEENPLSVALKEERGGFEYQENFQGTLDVLKQYILSGVQAHAALEQYRAEQLLQQLQEVVPQLDKEGMINVTMVFSQPQRITEVLQSLQEYFQLLRVDVIGQQENNLTPTDSSLKSQAEELVREGENMSDELSAQVFLEKVISGGEVRRRLQTTFEDDAVVAAFIKNISEQFSPEEVQYIYEEAIELFRNRQDQYSIFIEGNLQRELDPIIAQMLLGRDNYPGLFAQKEIYW